MKAIYRLIAAASIAVSAMTGCQEEQFRGDIDPNNYYASVETFDGKTKTALGADRSVVWSADDRIAVFENGTGTAYQILDSYVGKSSGEFSLVEGLTTGGLTDAADVTVAAYPFDEGLNMFAVSEDTYEISGLAFPAEQTYTPGSFADLSFPMVAVTASGSRNLSFKNVGGVLKLSLTGDYAVSSITLAGNSGELLSGTSSVTVGKDGIPSVQMDPETSGQEVTLLCDPAVQLDTETATDFYISIPPTDFEAGFTVTVLDEQGKRYSLETNKKNTVKRSSILAMPFKAAEFENLSEDEGEVIEFNDNVTCYGSEANEYFTIIDDTTLHISADASEDFIPQEGSLIYYDSGNISNRLFIGHVISVTEIEDGWEIKTEMPDLEDIFKNLSLSLSMNSSNTEVYYETSADDNIVACSVVDNSVWDDIETVYNTAEEDYVYRTKATSLANSSKVPIDITLELKTDPDAAFVGKVYIGIKGDAYITNLTNFTMDVNLRVGLNGSLGLNHKKEVKLPIFKLKKGLTLYNNKLLALRFVPEIDFVSEAGIRLEAGMNYEILNTNHKFVRSGDSFSDTAVEQLHDSYFRVKSLHSEAGFGISLGGDLYAFLFKENFFSAGTNLSAGVMFGAEKNVGIQFPEFANFDFSIAATPFF